VNFPRLDCEADQLPSWCRPFPAVPLFLANRSTPTCKETPCRRASPENHLCPFFWPAVNAEARQSLRSESHYIEKTGTAITPLEG